MATTGAPVWDETFLADADLSLKQFHFVTRTATGVAACAAAADRPIGVLQNAPKAGEAAAVRLLGRTKVVSDGSGAAIAPGDVVGPNAAGKAVKKATADHSVVGIADDASSADGTVIAVLLFGPSAFRVLVG